MSAWEIVLPAGLPMLNSNQRLHHHAWARATKKLREAGLIASLAARVPPLGEAFVLGYVHPGSLRRYDPGNFYPSFKAAVDGALVDAGVVPDDDHVHLSGPHMFPAPKVTGGQLRLVITKARRCLCGHDPMEHAGTGGRCVRPGCGCLHHRQPVPEPVRAPAGGAE